jgi:hypothetical protein
MPPDFPPEPWGSFLQELDAALPQPIELHCLGGFVMTMLYGLARPTADVDYLAIAPLDQLPLVERSAGRGSELHRKYGLYLQRVGVATVPENYADRLSELFPVAFERLRLLGLDPYDLALSKIERNTQRDRDDVRYLARRIPLHPDMLVQRYKEELRPNLLNPEREDLTLKLWIEAIFQGGE